jgi:hypothetical protein
VSWRQQASRSSGRRRASRCVVGTEALVGSLSVQAASSAGIERAGDSGCPKGAEEGNAVVLRHISVGTGRRHGTPSHANRDASFTRSFDPCSLILTMHRRVKPAVVGRCRRHRGQANPGNREELAPGSAEADVARLATCHCSAMSGVTRKKRKVVEAIVPARSWSPGLVARTSISSCRSRQAASGLE